MSAGKPVLDPSRFREKREDETTDDEHERTACLDEAVQVAREIVADHDARVAFVLTATELTRIDPSLGDEILRAIVAVRGPLQ